MDIPSDLGHQILAAALMLLISYCAFHVTYQRYFSPLAQFPGPWLWTCFRTPYVASMVTGRLPHDLHRLHSVYGPIVRVAPDELAFIDPAAWRDIYGTKPGQKAYPRPDVINPRPPTGGAFTLISADEESHQRLRKALAPAFAAKALHEQDGVVEHWAGFMMQRLRELEVSASIDGRPLVVDLVEWFNFVAFDIVGDLSFGDSFECLSRGRYHEWIEIMQSFKGTLLALGLKYYPFLPTLRQRILSRESKEAMRNLNVIATQKVRKRLEMGTSRADFVTHVLEGKAAGTSQITQAEVEANMRLFILGGSETLSTALIGTINCLMQNPAARANLVSELRSKFVAEADITARALQDLHYLNMVLKEGLRMCPPIPDGLRRELPPEGARVAGQFIPGRTTVSVAQWPAGQSSLNFKHPDRFIPERWDPAVTEYVSDRKDALQPFSLGKRSCLGTSLAWVELRVIMARLLWTFDVSVTPEGAGTVDWPSQRIFWNWEKKPLRLGLKSAKRT